MKYPVLVVILLFTAGVAFAQTEGARISGRVTDPDFGSLIRPSSAV
jgi:hypothetical protein